MLPSMERLKHRESALFLGNGLNRATGNDSWSDLLAALRQRTGASIERGHKAFPLYYELLYLEGMRREDLRNEGALKRLIAEHVGAIEPTALHAGLTAIRAPHIITTNYDPAIELALEPSGLFANTGVVQEAAYSLFRRSVAGGRQVWSIHGSHRRPSSILLGHHQYVGYVNRIARYVQAGPEYRRLTDPRSLGKRLARRSTPLHSWVDLLFCSDVHVLGFGFDPAEIHLWWLLGYRRRKQLSRDWSIPGKITFWTHDGEDADLLDLLRSHGVEIEGTAARPADHEWTDFYRDRLADIAGRS